MNTWPDGHKHAMTQDEHEAWNTSNDPGTLQLCCDCDSPTGRCEEDEIFTKEGIGPLCEECWHETEEYQKQPTN